MATYANDLRLKEIATGDESGTWGTSTNTNLSLIADAFSLGTKQLAADANETFTMPDAAADGTRSLYLKITSAVSLTVTRTVTLAPNTVSKVWIIENATTGGQSITIAQGSGGTVTIANGSKVMVVTDGAGAGAAVTNANPTAGTVTSVSGTGTVNGISLSGTVTSSGNLTLGGALANVNLASQVTGTLPVANGGTGITSFGAGVATFLGTPSSANLAAAVTDETGSGALVFATSPTLVTPALGTPSSATLTNATGLPIVNGTTGTLSVARGGTGDTTYTNGQLLIGNTTGNTLTKATLTAGAGVLVTNGTGSITVSGTNSDYVDLGNVSGTVNIDFTKGVVRARLTGNTTFAFISVPAAGTVTAVTLIVVQDGTGGRTVTWPAASDYPGGVIPPATTTVNAVDIWTLFTVDGGTTVYVSLAMKDAK
jgi:hypothetical protein